MELILKTIRIMLAYSDENAQAKFAQSMQDLRVQLGSLPGVEILPDWRHVVIGQNETVADAYSKVMVNIIAADLMVVVYSQAADDVAMETMYRCELCKPLRIFVHYKGSASRMIEACLMNNRGKRKDVLDPKTVEMPDPIKYFSTEGIQRVVAEWVKEHQQPETSV